MPDLNRTHDRGLTQADDDIEWELICSDREATLGVLLTPVESSPRAAGTMARSRPWRHSAFQVSRDPRASRGPGTRAR